MSEYLVDVSELLESVGSSFPLDSPFDLGILEVGDERFVLTGPAQVDGTLTNAGEGLVATGTVSAHVSAECVRCLRPFDLTISGDIEGFYVRGEHAGEVEDAELIAPDKTIDAGPALTAALVVSAPFAPLHDPECAGLCPKCGADLNEGPCGCARDVDDSHPFSALGDLLPRNEDQETD